MTKLFVGNFSFAIDEAKLREYFSQVGTVISAKVMTEGPGGRSRGFGFVELASPEEAKKAIAELDGKVWEGRAIKVSEDRSFRRGGHDGPRRGGEEGSGDDDSQGSRPVPLGYFRAQPLDLGIRRRRKLDPFVEDPNLLVDYKNPKLLSRFMSERGRILPRRMTGLTAHNQRLVTKAIRRSQQLGLLPVLRSR
jgi:ribosomal protein S18